MVVMEDGRGMVVMMEGRGYGGNAGGEGQGVVVMRNGGEEGVWW